MENHAYGKSVCKTQSVHVRLTLVSKGSSISQISHKEYQLTNENLKGIVFFLGDKDDLLVIIAYGHVSSNVKTP